MNQFFLVLGAMCVAVLIAALARRRRVDSPTQASFDIPQQLDREDFVSPHVPWLVAIFTSATCDACADMATKAAVLASEQVAVQRIDFTQDPVLHSRYNIEAVPTLVIADAAGVVLKGFLGPVKAQDLWAAVAECREPGSTPQNGHCGLDHSDDR